MLTVKREGIILEKTTNEFENDSVLNPAVIADGNTLHMFYRAVKEGNRSSIGYCRLEGPLQVIERRQSPLLTSQFDYESQGVEDQESSRSTGSITLPIPLTMVKMPWERL